ncbi:ion transporter [Saccharicrinis aurantiacus]|uniref:ion transporter n=1 Tax=Saccharicrinis aurantiacus TaxID=1849719 RepID=UPI00094FD395|nr:ion transporter [Saccharicrinis aurantiacus]
MTLREKIFEIIFKSDTPKAKAFDILLILLITFSIIVVMLESIPGKSVNFYAVLNEVEWIVGLIFIGEYLVRLIVSPKPLKYALSFYGVIDLLAILPTVLVFVYTDSHALLVLRSLRLLRVFRVLKLTRYIKEAAVIYSALKSSSRKIGVFLFAIVIIVTILGTLMYLIEGNADSGFISIPISIYWAIVTLTTVGYGDIAPVTALGQFVSSFIMILGYAIIAVPTGIVTAELTRPVKNAPTCSNCKDQDHKEDAKYCKSCGTAL